MLGLNLSQFDPKRSTIQNISVLSQGRAGALRGLWRCDFSHHSASNLGAIAMTMSAELPVQTPAADRQQIDRAWKDVLKIGGDSVVLAVAVLFLVILVAASVTLPS